LLLHLNRKVRIVIVDHIVAWSAHQNQIVEAVPLLRRLGWVVPLTPWFLGLYMADLADDSLINDDGLLAFGKGAAVTGNCE
jgi:hypothetical protein